MGLLFVFRNFPFFLFDWNETPVFSATCNTGVAEKLPNQHGAKNAHN
jgi:hypothetical protein